MQTTLPAAKANRITGPQRGDALPSGGRFVGRAATLWVSYGDEADFRQMCRDFDRIWNPVLRRTVLA